MNSVNHHQTLGSKNKNKTIDLTTVSCVFAPALRAISCGFTHVINTFEKEEFYTQFVSIKNKQLQE